MIWKIGQRSYQISPSTSVFPLIFEAIKCLFVELRANLTLKLQNQLTPHFVQKASGARLSSISDGSILYEKNQSESNFSAIQHLRTNQTSVGLELLITDDSDWRLFDEIGVALQQEFHGLWLSKVDGLNQRYRDLKIDTSILTFHLEHYLGIMLFPAAESSDKTTPNSLPRQIHTFLSSYEPTA